MHEAGRQRTRELTALARTTAVLAGQTVALCLGQDPKIVAEIGTNLIEALSEEGGDR